MRFFWWLVVLSILIPAGLAVYAVLATHTSDSTGATLTTIGVSLVLGVLIDASGWLLAFTVWSARTHRRDWAAEDRPVANPS
jgi:ABC-type Na+ efflux pump permease subunit